MRIDATHRPWLLATLLLLGLALIGYVPYSMRAGGPSGGSVPGLLYGIAGYGMMLFAALLGARKKVPVWRIGRAQTWMRGHLWLGLLSLPMILLHSGFALGGPLTGLLMLLLWIVVLSGVAGAAIQHFVPRAMTRAVPLETIYEEIPHVREQLREEADQLVMSVCGVPAAAGRAEAAPAIRMLDQDVIVEIDPENRARFQEIYRQRVRPVLLPGSAAWPDLAPAFAALRKLVPAAAHAMVGDLESICEEERQLRRQARLYGYLHGWLLVHVPLSVALLVLGGVHAVVALRY